jgi:hypothetical protein
MLIESWRVSYNEDWAAQLARVSAIRAGVAADVRTNEERLAFVDFIARNPEAGDLIPETGGGRKVRWSRQGSGKRGGGARDLFSIIAPIGRFIC